MKKNIPAISLNKMLYIFYKERFKDYYVRTYIEDIAFYFPHRISGKDNHTTTFQLQIDYLLDPEYAIEKPYKGNEALEHNRYCGKNEKDFLKKMENYFRDEKKIIDDKIKTQTNKRMRIRESNYLNKCIKKKHKIIILKIEIKPIKLNFLFKKLRNIELNEYCNKLFVFASLFKLGDKTVEEYCDWFITFALTIFSPCEYEKKTEEPNAEEFYYTMFCVVNELIDNYLKNGIINKDLIIDINEFKIYSKYEDKDPLFLFICSFFNDFISQLKNKNIVKTCKVCKRLFINTDLKKTMCDLEIDGRSCKKTIENKKYYKKNKDKILPRMIEYMRETNKMNKRLFGKIRISKK